MFDPKKIQGRTVYLAIVTSEATTNFMAKTETNVKYTTIKC
jgi:hypothetical protein